MPNLLDITLERIPSIPMTLKEMEQKSISTDLIHSRGNTFKNEPFEKDSDLDRIRNIIAKQNKENYA